MGLRQCWWDKEKKAKVGGYATIWSIEDKGNNIMDAQLSTSRKNKDGKYETDFSAFVSLMGPAYELAKTLTEPTRIMVTSFEVKNSYYEPTKTTYNNYAIYGFDILGSFPSTNGKEFIKSSKKKSYTKSSNSANDFAYDPTDIPDSDEDELPFV